MRQRLSTKLMCEEDGSNLVEAALVVPVMVLMLIGAVDFGRGYYAAIEVSAAAEAGALYGTQNISDTSGIVAAAKLDAADLAVTPTVIYGCECADGTAASTNCATPPTCSTHAVNFVQVTTTGTYSSIISYPGIPSPLTLTGTARMRAGQ